MKGMGNDLVREARRRVGLTQAQLAELAGTTQSSIARLESGSTSPSFDDVIRYLRLMGLDLDFMLVERDDQDWAHTQRTRALSISQRHDRLVEWNRSVSDLRQQFDRGRSDAA